VLVGDPQPTDALAAGQAPLLGGVHLPDVVGVRGAVGAGLRPSPLGGRRQAGVVEPALQRPGRRQCRGREVVPEQDADQRRAPGGVLATELQGRLLQGRGRARVHGSRAGVAGEGGGRPVLA
jgi:hypothetical protein